MHCQCPLMMTAHCQSLQRNNTACRDIPPPSSRESLSKAPPGTAHGKPASSGLWLLSPHALQRVKPTEPRLRRVLMLCFPLRPSSSSFTGLNIKGGGSTGFSMGGSSPYFLKWMRQSVHNRMFSRPPWCQSLEAWGRESNSSATHTAPQHKHRNCLKSYSYKNSCFSAGNKVPVCGEKKFVENFVLCQCTSSVFNLQTMVVCLRNYSSEAQKEALSALPGS